MSKARKLREEILLQIRGALLKPTRSADMTESFILTAIAPELDELVTMAEQNHGQQGVFNGGTFINTNGRDNPK